jgi:hypothetical protein
MNAQADIGAEVTMAALRRYPAARPYRPPVRRAPLDMPTPAGPDRLGDPIGTVGDARMSTPQADFSG